MTDRTRNRARTNCRQPAISQFHAQIRHRQTQALVQVGRRSNHLVLSSFFLFCLLRFSRLEKTKNKKVEKNQRLKTFNGCGVVAVTCLKHKRASFGETWQKPEACACWNRRNVVATGIVECEEEKWLDSRARNARGRCEIGSIRTTNVARN